MPLNGSLIFHGIADIVSKNVFGICSWYLRWVILEGKGSGLQGLEIKDAKTKGKKGERSSTSKSASGDSDSDGGSEDASKSSRKGKKSAKSAARRRLESLLADPSKPVQTVMLEGVVDIEDARTVAFGAVDAVWEALQDRELSICIVEPSIENRLQLSDSIRNNSMIRASVDPLADLDDVPVAMQRPGLRKGYDCVIVSLQVLEELNTMNEDDAQRRGLRLHDEHSVGEFDSSDDESVAGMSPAAMLFGKTFIAGSDFTGAHRRMSQDKAHELGCRAVLRRPTNSKAVQGLVKDIVSYRRIPQVATVKNAYTEQILEAFMRLRAVVPASSGGVRAAKKAMIGNHLGGPDASMWMMSRAFNGEDDDFDDATHVEDADDSVAAESVALELNTVGRTASRHREDRSVDSRGKGKGSRREGRHSSSRGKPQKSDSDGRHAPADRGSPKRSRRHSTAAGKASSSRSQSRRKVPISDHEDDFGGKPVDYSDDSRIEASRSHRSRGRSSSRGRANTRSRSRSRRRQDDYVSGDESSGSEQDYTDAAESMPPLASGGAQPQPLRRIGSKLGLGMSR